jgi:hypothetical protein
LLDDDENVLDTDIAPNESDEQNLFIDPANDDIHWQPDNRPDDEQYSRTVDADVDMDADPLAEAFSDTDTDQSDMDDLETECRNWSLDDSEILPLNADVQVKLPSVDPPLPVEHDGGPRPQNEPTHLDERDLPSPPKTFIEKFTRGRAGAPLHDHDIPTHEQYQNKLNNSDNVFEPFKSKIDWEFAQWAKTSGASSTAVTNILSIEGVRIGLGYCVQYF